MPTTTGTYTTGLKDENGWDLGIQLVEQAYVTAVGSLLSPAYLAPIGQKSGFAFVSGGITYNLDDIYVRNDLWRQGQLLNWGQNSYGQLGIQSVSDVSSPMQTVAGGYNWKYLAVGCFHVAGIKTDGTIWLTGRNSFGQLGDNTTTNRSSPVQVVGGGTNWRFLNCGGKHTAAIKTDGTLWLWGNNAYGQLGTNNITNTSSPIQTVSGGTTWRQVECGYHHSAAIKSDGTLWLWGINAYGCLGDNTRVNKSSPVQTISGGTTWRQVSCSDGNANTRFSSISGHTAAIKTDNTLWLWGLNNYGQLGDNSVTDKSSPVQTVAGGNDWRFVSCGERHTAAIKTDGTMWCWGLGTSGQLGNNAATNRSSPVQVVGSGSWNDCSAGGAFTIGTKTDGTLWGFGYAQFGQLGNLDLFAKSSPVQTSIGGTAWRQPSCALFTAAALTYDDQPFTGSIPAPPPASAPTCWVARAVYGEFSPSWVLFRDWMLNDAPKWLLDTYVKYGEQFSLVVKRSKLLQLALRSVMNLAIRNRKLPQDYIEHVIETYRSPEE